MSDGRLEIVGQFSIHHQALLVMSQEPIGTAGGSSMLISNLEKGLTRFGMSMSI